MVSGDPMTKAQCSDLLTRSVAVVERAGHSYSEMVKMNCELALALQTVIRLVDDLASEVHRLKQEAAAAAIADPGSKR